MGCSVSGEMEMRMALGHWRAADGTPLDSGDEVEGNSEDENMAPRYRFRETPMPANMKNGKGIKLGGRVKKLGMGLLELVLGRK